MKITANSKLFTIAILLATPATCSHCGKKVMVMFDDLDYFNEFGCEQCYFDNDESNDLVWGNQ